MSKCTADEIAEKRRIALEKLNAKKAQNSTSLNAQFSPKNLVKSPIQTAEIEERKRIALEKLNVKRASNETAQHIQHSRGAHSNPTKAPSQPPENKGSSFLNALKHINSVSNRQLARDAAHPYHRKPESKTGPQVSTFDKNHTTVGSSINQQIAPVFVKSISCQVYMISSRRFAVLPSGYHEKLIQVFKQIPSKSYDANTRIWNFALSDYPLVQKHVGDLKPAVVIGNIPKNVIELCRQPQAFGERTCLASIEPTIAEKLLPFQQEGVCFAIGQRGRVMICDEMGLGKTYQALAVADYFKDSWPLLICTTASTRDSWSSHIRQLLPKVPVHCIQILANNQPYIDDVKVLIASYNMMERHVDQLVKQNFGFLIFDESHNLKNSKAKCTMGAERLALNARHVVLVSGTPALSRPVELYTQLRLIDRKFMSYKDFTLRYCDAKQTNFGWDASGQSNLEELNLLLKLKFMIRRTKADVLPEMAEKFRETVVLDPALVHMTESTKQLTESLNQSFSSSKGKEREEILLRFYALTAEIKAPAVCAYLKTVVKEQDKFIIFAHHRVLLDAICDCLAKLKVSYIRIDGTTRGDLRSEYINTFQQKSACKVAVLSLKACNAGITLTAADMIIFAELDWNPSTLAQAESRAHRIGQLKPVICRYLMASKTADDVIWNMLKSKQDILKKAGIFCENLQEATHSAAPTMSHKINEYFSPTKSEQVNEKKATENESKSSPMTTATTIKHFFSPSQIKLDKSTNNNNTSEKLEIIQDFFKGEDDDLFSDLTF